MAEMLLCRSLPSVIASSRAVARWTANCSAGDRKQQRQLVKDIGCQSIYLPLISAIFWSTDCGRFCGLHRGRMRLLRAVGHGGRDGARLFVFAFAAPRDGWRAGPCISVKFVGSDNRTYDDGCGVIPNHLSGRGEL
jgi:hypothetical protein